MKHTFKAFTLVEVLAVVAVIGILSALAIGPIRAAKIRGRDSQRKADLNLVSQGLDLYLSEKKVLPGTASGSCNVTYTSKDSNWAGVLETAVLPYIPARAGQGLPKDPANNTTYFYTYTCTSPSSYTLQAVLENTKDPEGTGTSPVVYKLIR